MGLSYKGLNFFKEIAKMFLELAAGATAGATAAAATRADASSADCICYVIIGGALRAPL